ncbi:Protein of unknown function [Chitinophaga costaii]|uniref:Uncharacterized protein n=1 Tax=Chitinophaga costaii TaxID=1335309 RepID=A0A1C4E785_9BACT|nr:DUF1573 domain-containing protein [Chitinophaga costaii]PUZ24279.1 DUF1573 domain-containing protein [Chitinophaga costaii]SCC39381.1 Protein of unknown function [Chitinophaga costaii]
MKLFSYLIATALLLGACRQGQPAHTASPAASDSSQQGFPVITFDQEVHDFGTVHEGEVVEYSFKFKNTGHAPLLITDAQASCGCTIPEWPKAPIKPGEESELKVSFNSSGKEGAQEKSISIKANTETPFIPGPRIVCNVVK